MTIELNHNKCKLNCSIKTLIALRKHPQLCIKVPGAFFTPAYQRGRWDGKIYFISERGIFDTGKLPEVIEILKKMKWRPEIIDQRGKLPKAHLIPQTLNGVKLRRYQFDAIKRIKYNKVYGNIFPRGILDMATNAGKTIISAGIYQTYQTPTAFYVKSKELYKQAIKDISLFLPGKVGYISATDGEYWNDFMVIMVPSVVAKMDKYGPRLAKFKVVIVDECDESLAKGFQEVLKYTYNAAVKVGLSGSVFTNKLAKHKLKNEKVRASFGNVLYKVSNKELMEQKFSSDVEVFFHQGRVGKKYPKDYNKEYEYGIIKDKVRNGKIVCIIDDEVRKYNYPILVMVKNHEHINQLMKYFEHADLEVDWVHHKREDRDEVVERFRTGEISILIGSYILKRGKNFPLMKSLINAAGGDSMENVLQILGRATRKHESKLKTNVHDFYDRGHYLRRHSYHRLIVYKNEKLKVNHLYDLKLLK